MKLKPKIFYGVKPKDEDWLYIPDDLFPNKKEAMKRRKDYVHQDEMEIIKLKLVQIK